MTTYILDVTTLVVLTTDIGRLDDVPTRFGSIDEWKERSNIIYEQIIDDMKDPLIPKIENMLNGSKLLVPQSAFDEYHNIIANHGSLTEQKRMEEIIKRITIIPDNISVRFKMMTGKKWNKHNKAVFGTADKLKNIVVTGNKSMVEFIDACDIDMKFILHRSRGIIGTKYEK